MDTESGETLDSLLNPAVATDERVRRLIPLIYDQLRGAAQQALMQERADHTLEATALVHEAYLRLVGQREIPWQNRAHFYVAAAEAMRRVLLDHAKGRGRLKRGGDLARVPLGDVADSASIDSETILALDDALRRLEGEHRDVAEVVRLRFYTGLTIDETAVALGVSPRQVDRWWAFGRAWLFRELKKAWG